MNREVVSRPAAAGGAGSGFARRLGALAAIAAVAVPVVYVLRAYPDEARLWTRILVLEARRLVASLR